ncbi:phosphoketolase family protein [Pseudomonas putida]|uniref:Probable phosphoketolase n=1 Tax=Pseudomonas putida TaxID=303 RepID=A0A2S3WL53_PSEPU|nr:MULTISPECIES: phosphoketolase family protein [Pseudomonas]MDF3174102.1 phosphoketolase family protein [Pseudomonas sp. ER28]MDX3741047.1 phosphoketolase family protein [Pseudomonas sp.]MDY7072884.1 Xylulose-5-phosphate/fructose-6-phosphate phosphoketolase [Pseudomonas hunanensis]POG00899.1 phosphoketolase [Pseudomonas putida]HDS0961095.1 phosphoketolase family protein [Pseudomonas putida]
MSDVPGTEELESLDAYWRAANYLTVGQIYLQDNALLTRPLTLADVKPRLLGHWGTSPGLNLIYTHLNRLIRQYSLDVLFVTGPGHGGPALVAQAYLDGTYTELNPSVGRNALGMARLFRQFSWPYGIGSHVGPHVPGSIHEGGELGYSLAHAYGAALDNPHLIVACVIGDGEAETGPLAASWHCNKFLNPARDGAVLPILHLNGYKIANPSVLSMISEEELTSLMYGYGYDPYFVEGDEPMDVHRALARTLEVIYEKISQIQRLARHAEDPQVIDRPLWPVLILRTPKGWTGPRYVDGQRVEGTWRSHQLPLSDLGKPPHLLQLQQWLESYRPHELFDAQGALLPELAALTPTGRRRMSANPHANGGLLLRALDLPHYADYCVPMPGPGQVRAESTRVLGGYVRDVMKNSLASQNFRLFGPDETASNRLDAVFEVTDKVWLDAHASDDGHLSAQGRVMEILSEHICEGWLEGYLLTGRHGLFSCYEAFIHIVDSMINQHAKWLKTAAEVPWRKPIASLNILLTSHVWRQDHNGFSHQDPGLLDLLANKKANLARIYLPPDANCLLSVAEHCLRSRGYINVIVAGKQMEWQWLDSEAAAVHCQSGIGRWGWASHDDEMPDVVLACAGDVPTLEVLAAVTLLQEQAPDVRVRVVNVVDLMALQLSQQHPHGLSDSDFNGLFTEDRPVIFAFHGYPALIHRLIYKRANPQRFHVRGFREEGATTTPFDMAVINNLDRYQLLLDVFERVPRLQPQLEQARARYWATMEKHKLYLIEHGEDMPEVAQWRWTSPPGA